MSLLCHIVQYLNLSFLGLLLGTVYIMFERPKDVQKGKFQIVLIECTNYVLH